MFKNKYIKYKNKYLNLKKQLGSSRDSYEESIDEEGEYYEDDTGEYDIGEYDIGEYADEKYYYDSDPYLYVNSILSPNTNEQNTYNINNINIRDDNGNTPIYNIINIINGLPKQENEQKLNEIFNLLVNNNIDLCNLNNANISILTYLLTHDIHFSSSKTDIIMLQSFIDKIIELLTQSTCYDILEDVTSDHSPFILIFNDYIKLINMKPAKGSYSYDMYHNDDTIGDAIRINDNMEYMEYILFERLQTLYFMFSSNTHDYLKNALLPVIEELQSKENQKKEYYKKLDKLNELFYYEVGLK